VSLLDVLKRLFRGAEDVAGGETPVATPPGGEERETSTNAQVEGAVGQPWPGSDDG
jgi:hypothetical protein